MRRNTLMVMSFQVNSSPGCDTCLVGSVRSEKAT